MSGDFLSQEEVDDLLKGLSGESDEAPEVEEGGDGSARAYNLGTQERIVRGRMPTLEMINERFARFDNQAGNAVIEKVIQANDRAVGQI